MNLANKITLFRVFLVPVFMISFYIESPGTTYISALIFVFASLTDTLDGYIARSRNLVTNFGKFVDPLADKVLTSAALILLVGAGKIPSWIVILIITREFTISGFRILAASEGVTIAASPWGKLKTITQLIAIILLLIDNFPFSIMSFPMDIIMVYVALALTIISGVDYIARNLDTLKTSDF